MQDKRTKNLPAGPASGGAMSDNRRREVSLDAYDYNNTNHNKSNHPYRQKRSTSQVQSQSQSALSMTPTRRNLLST